jgi:hypothetical protein
MQILLTCHIENCENADIAIEATVEDLETTSAICGGCENEITDKVEAPTE